jgi:natural product biosynthesis luciferase-like monooxygenase protein/amino acid adenylation domain-containing protein
MEPIAIIGIGCRFPGADNPEAFWQLMQAGVDAIADVPLGRWDIESFYDPTPGTEKKMYSRQGGFLKNIDQFDPQFFRISPLEANYLDPQQRLLLEVAWEALENAAIVPETLAGSKSGVFIGISDVDYHRLAYQSPPNLTAYVGTGNSTSIAANRLSYVLDLRGPSLALDTACSSSLVAVHLACQSLQMLESNLCLVGGVNLILSPETTVVFSQARMMAPDSRCKTFDASADGYVRSEGCGMVILKRLEDAIEDGDRVLAVIKGSAVNQDGLSNGLTAPNGPAQQAVIRQALENAQVEPAQISYIEAHGTGTELGDPIEVKSLKAVLGEKRSLDQTCWLGSVKTNIGHLEAAAGIAGLIKVVLCLQHQEIPPNLHFKTLNPYISLAETAFAIPTQSQPWQIKPNSSGENGVELRLAGISSFGFGGTNSHVIVSEVPTNTQIAKEIEQKPLERPWHLLTLSAKNEEALKASARRYQQYLANHPDIPLADVCFTANSRRSHFNHRLALVAKNSLEMGQKLEHFCSLEKKTETKNPKKRKSPKIVFLFAGQGCQYVGMGRQLYETQPTFQKTLDRCAEILRPYLDKPLLEILYPSDLEPETASFYLEQTAYTQPALFALEYALAELWRSWGIEPAVVMGHSVGEYVAATVAGAISLEDGLTLIAQRGKLMQSLPQEGAMAAVFTSEDRVKAAIQPYETEVSIAAINSPENIVISGKATAIAQIILQLTAEGIEVRPLKVSHAFHSPLMEPILDSLEQAANQVSYQALRIPLVANLTGEILAEGETLDAHYWRNQAEKPVKFLAGIQTLIEQKFNLFLEVSPKPTLSRLGQQSSQERSATWLFSLAPPQENWQSLLNSLAILYDSQGAKINWEGFDRDYPQNLLALPTYPFQRQRYWLETINPTSQEINMTLNAPDSQAVLTDQRQQEILITLQTLVGNLLQMAPADVNVHTPFLEIGADSIVMVEAVRRIENTYGVKIAIRQLFEELSTLEALAIYLAQNLATDFQTAPVNTEVASAHREADLCEIAACSINRSVNPNSNGFHNQTASTVFSAEVPQVSVPQPNNVPATVSQVSSSGLESIMSQQLQLMAKQLEVLQTANFAPSIAASPENSPSPITQIKVNAPPTPPTPPTPPPLPLSPSPQPKITATPWGPRKPPTGGLTPQQQQHLDALIARFTERTKTSKQIVQRDRPVVADSRASVGFRLSIKEMLYPIVAQRSQGSRVWDVDGNEYVDMTMGQGVTLFGHQPDFIMSAIQSQLSEGIHLSPRSPIVGEVATLICELTGAERACFCSSGTEAVMSAIRIARGATGRNKIALFEGSYHGHADVTLVRKQIIDNEPHSFPLTSGVSPSISADVVVLEYGSAEALDYLQTRGQDLAAVLVEPVQSNYPLLQPRQFLQSLRQITSQMGIALIFDEMITGFRCHPGGAQALFGIQADIATYGKVVAGGMPIGVIAGKARYLDGIDGGMWNYGDKSYPGVDRTFFAGTFNQYPLAMRTARAVLTHLKEQGPSLQQQLNDRTAALADTLNQYFQAEDVPIKIEHFSSFFRFALAGNLDLLFYHMVEKGIYVWEWRKHFLSTAHTEADLAQFVQTVKDSVAELRQGGFLPAKKPSWSVQTPQTDPPLTPLDKGGESCSVNDRKLGQKSRSQAQKTMQFSLYYFGSYEAEFNPNKYNLLFEGAKFGDRAGFTAIWLPERHFHAFGGFSPNPSVLAAALARETKQIQLRSGSVVLPLHHSIRVAEEWAVVDNLSQGRIGIAFASGWHSQDFVLAPQSFGQHRELMFREIENVQKLWRGEAIAVLDGKGQTVEVKTYPQPMQSQLPTWITIVNNPDTYIRAGAIGAGILTNLMGQSVEDLARNIALYRQSLTEHGYDPASGTVTVLLHTFVGNDLEQVREQARQPFGHYLTSSVGLLQNMVKSQGMEVDFERLKEEDREFLLASAYKRYVETSALIGTPESCCQIIDHLQSVGVDEVACFIDFGVDEQTVLANLPHLQTLKELYQPHIRPYPGKLEGDQNLPPYQGKLEGDQNLPPYQGKLEGDQNLPPYQGGLGGDHIPLTEAQRQLWILAQLGENGSVAYNQSVTLQLRGPLNPVAMTQAIQQISDRHEALRTKINAQGDSQEILPQVEINCPILDLGTDQQQQWLKAESQKPFDLSQGSLVRWHLLKLEPELHLLVLTTHHIIADGWSMGVILRELGELYSAECQGIRADLKTPKQFRELIAWQTQPSQQQELKKQEAYWLATLTNPPVLNLPTDQARPALPSYQANRQSLILDSQFTEQLKQFSRKNGCTLLMTLLSVYNLLIHRLTGQDDILVGLPASGRALLDSEGMVGYCTHFLPIRSQLAGNPSFADYLKQMRGVLLSAYEHQDYPFALLLSQLNLPHNTSRSPLIDVSFNLEPAISLPKMRGLEVSLLPQPISFKDRDLHLNVTEMGGEALIDCDYNTDLFKDETIQRWLGHFQTLLESVINDPQQNLRQLSLLSPAQRQQLLVDWNNTKTDYPQDQCIHQLFEAQVERTPDAIAVVFENQQLTYTELHGRANQLAHYLQTLGVGPEVLVGIAVERSLEMIVGLLGILKAGGAYVPLDPDYPPERLQFMLEDAQAPFLITQRSLLAILPPSQATLICLDDIQTEVSQYSQDNLQNRLTGYKLANVIYTSGSTGKPKGVMVEHRGLLNLAIAQIQTFAVHNHSRVLQFASFSFDACISEILMTFGSGATLYLAPKDSLLPGQPLIECLQKNGITHVTLPPSALGVLPKEPLPALQTLIVAGEACSPDLVKQWSVGRNFFNAYGPTEASVCASIGQCSKADWNQIKTDYAQDFCIHQLFEAQVERTPDAVAVIFETQQLTYGELNQRANQLAHYLQSLGVGPEVLVGIAVERSLEMIVGLLGILKAGGVYVPIDPDYPPERLQFMLEDSQVSLLLTQQHLLPSFSQSSETATAKIICLDSDDQTIAQAKNVNPENSVTTNNLAYVIYTSGSTGKPKGAMNTHRGISNRLLWMQEAYQLTAEDCVLQKTPFSFDVSVWELFWPLLNGARLVFAKPNGHKDASYLVKLIQEQQVTTLHFVPSMLQVFLTEKDVENCTSIKRVICSGEALSLELQERFFARLTCELHNLYGPTEAAIDVTFWQCQSDSNLKTVPIGRPIANTQIYILDAYLQPVPIGVIGELHIGGVGLARGYLNRPELTVEKFIASPFDPPLTPLKKGGDESNKTLKKGGDESDETLKKWRDQLSRLYKTGDLARYLPDGNIEYVGRIDNQVKIRGFRIELGEIEAVLLSHPQVREAVVLVSDNDQPENRALVAYVVVTDPAFTIQSLREFVKQQVPNYMVPDHWLILENLPLSSNGKIDRRALPLPNPELNRSVDYVAPDNPTQEAIAAIFGQVLKLEKVGIDDNFFEIGGNSLQATQVISRLRESLSLELPLRRLFERPTVADLALVVTEIQTTLQKLQTPIDHLSGDREEIEL